MKRERCTVKWKVRKELPHLQSQLTNGRYLRDVRRLIPALLFIWIFTHLRQTSGLDLSWRWSDLYLLLSFLTSSPLLLASWQEWRRQHREKRATHTTAVQDGENQPRATSAASTTKQSASTPVTKAARRRGRWLDQFIFFCGRLVLDLLILVVSPPFGLYWLVRHFWQQLKQ